MNTTLEKAQRLPERAREFGYVSVDGKLLSPQGYVSAECELALRYRMRSGQDFSIYLELTLSSINRKELTYNLFMRLMDKNAQRTGVLVHVMYADGRKYDLSYQSIIKPRRVEFIPRLSGLVRYLHAIVYAHTIEEPVRTDDHGNQISPQVDGIMRTDMEKYRRWSGIEMEDAMISSKLLLAP